MGLLSYITILPEFAFTLPEINPAWRTVLWNSLIYNPSSPLQLPSAFMIVALLFFLGIFATLHNRRRARNLFTTLFSLYLYYKLSGPYLILLLLIALSDYFMARGVAGTNSQKRRKLLVALSVTVNVSILVFFKANGVFADFVESFSKGGISLSKIAVPAGISFFCFQSISYVVDSYRGKISPLKHFSDYLFLLSFFPKMFLGPLVRNSDFIAQMQREDISISKEDVGQATRMIILGTLKFCILSKIIGQFFVAPAFAGTLGDDGFTALMAVYAFTIQLYCDFSGYTDLATGISLLVGYRLPLNFNLPYHSATITEFWRRWHISLSSWLRDYLYIPLGGNRRGTFRTYLNLLLTMILGGLWHGVGLMFLLWGLWHGVLLCLHKLWMQFVPGAVPLGKDLPLWRRTAGIFFTFNAVAFGWLMFRSPDWTCFSTILTDIFGNFSLSTIPQTIVANSPAFSAILIAYLLHVLPSSLIPRLDRFCTAIRLPGQALLLSLTIWVVLQIDAIFFATASNALPIYANF